jgi:hypothetical protein
MQQSAREGASERECVCVRVWCAPKAATCAAAVTRELKKAKVYLGCLTRCVRQGES